jgi:hypothetical protein
MIARSHPRGRWPRSAAVALSFLLAGSAGAYPGGTPSFQTDVTPFCAACHSSRSADALAGAGERAEKEVAENKHIAGILAGAGNYEKLSEADRKTLAEHIRAVDANSTIELEFPPQVGPGETFQVTARVTGGGGPVVAIALVDRAHRWYARPASASGWTVVGAPTIIGPDGRPQTEWLKRRPERFGTGITYVNITGVASDAMVGEWAKARVIFTLKAPDVAGDYPLTAAYLYGTEKATSLGFVQDPVTGRKNVMGGYTGKSGRVLFTDEHVVTVKAEPAPPPPAQDGSGL